MQVEIGNYDSFYEKGVLFSSEKVPNFSNMLMVSVNSILLSEKWEELVVTPSHHPIISHHTAVFLSLIKFHIVCRY